VTEKEVNKNPQPTQPGAGENGGQSRATDNGGEDMTRATVINPDMVNRTRATAPEVGKADQTHATEIHASDLNGESETLFEPGQTLDTQMREATKETELGPMHSGGGTKATELRDQEGATNLLSGTALPGNTKPARMSSSSVTMADEHEAKYEIIRSLGKGGFAWVYLVRNLHLDRLEAIKILNTDLNEDNDVKTRFVKEARIAANFSHQNIVMVYEVQVRGKWSMFSASEDIRERHREPFTYFSMSFVEGKTATDMIKKQTRLDQKTAISIIMDAAAALEYAHQKGVVHRDIKPDNILVDHRGNGIVMDFGIAKAADQTRRTAAGTFMGTARYVSPEQAMGKEIDGRSDIYSLGVTLYELATGRVPFSSDQWMTVLYQHINEPPPAPEKFFEDINRDLRGIILKMLEKKPEDRFQTAREVLDALRQVFLAMGGQARHTSPMDEIATRQDFLKREGTAATDLMSKGIPPVRTKSTVRGEEIRPRKRSKAPLFLGLTALAVVLVVAAFFLFKPSPVVPPPELKSGSVLLDAYPNGRILKITNEAGEEVSFEGSPPLTLNLPEGNYKVIFARNGITREVTGFVGPDVKLTRIRARFEVEDEAFLLEDLK